jgi:hypothetical protein
MSFPLYGVISKIKIYFKNMDLMKNLERIKTVGFKLAGNWGMENGELNYKQEPNSKDLWASSNALYAFVNGYTGEILYIGKTTRTPVQRFFGYKKPGNTQATNKKVNFKIKTLLNEHTPISIYLFEGTIHLRWGEFSVNLAAGLEDELIKVILPKLNGKTTESEVIELENLELANEIYAEESPLKSFTVVLGETYLHHGYINPGVASKNYIDQTIGSIDVYLGKNSKSPIHKKIDWKANNYRSARISVGKELLNWYSENGFVKGDEVTGVIESPISIRLLNKAT